MLEERTEMMATQYSVVKHQTGVNKPGEGCSIFSTRGKILPGSKCQEVTGSSFPHTRVIALMHS